MFKTVFGIRAKTTNIAMEKIKVCYGFETANLSAFTFSETEMGSFKHFTTGLFV